MKVGLVLGSVALLATLTSASSARDATSCAAGTRCIKVTRDGIPSATGTYVATCSGRFPDFITLQDRIAGWNGEMFRLAQNYPASDPGTDAPWRSIDFRTPLGSVDEIAIESRSGIPLPNPA